ncbi:MAG TPA: type II secretion system F family protein [Burkholderiaceae bacterium]|nr:type II secretion system F family protein [Burkholderiaceae bacterium]
MFFWLSCLAAGLSLYLLVWVAGRPALKYQRRGRPNERRSLLAWMWPWVLALAPLCAPFISWRARQRLVKHIQRAGMDRAWQPEHVVALQCLGLIVPVALPMFVLPMLGMVLPGGGWLSAVGGVAGIFWPRSWLHRCGRERQQRMLREFPFMLDMTTLCVEAGLNLQGALQQAAEHGPEGPLRAELRHALADMRAGMPRAHALSELAERTDLDAVRRLVTALAQADQLGMSLGPLLRAQSEQRRAERFLRAEKLALEAPVKMLFPMVFCIFPCTFLVIGFPIAVKLLGAGF